MDAFEIEKPESYSPEAFQEILQLALHQELETESLSRSQIYEIAWDLGIHGTVLAQAEEQWLTTQLIQNQKTKFNQYRRQILRQKLVKYAIANGVFLLLDLLHGGRPTWSLSVLLLWGLFLSFKALRLLQTQGEQYDQDFQRWQLQSQIKATVSTLWGKAQQFLKS